MLATLDPAVRWRIILTDNTGRAIAVARVPRVSARSGPWAAMADPARRPASEPRHAGLLGRVTIIIPESILSPASPDQFDGFASGGRPGGNLAASWERPSIRLTSRPPRRRATRLLTLKRAAVPTTVLLAATGPRLTYGSTSPRGT